MVIRLKGFAPPHDQVFQYDQDTIVHAEPRVIGDRWIQGLWKHILAIKNVWPAKSAYGILVGSMFKENPLAHKLRFSEQLRSDLEEKVSHTTMAIVFKWRIACPRILK